MCTEKDNINLNITPEALEELKQKARDLNGNGTAKVNLGAPIPVYNNTDGNTGIGTRIGTIGTNECYVDDSVYYPTCWFLNSSLRVVDGFHGKYSNQGNYSDYVSNGSTLVRGTSTSRGVVHTLKKAQPWFLGSTNKGNLAVGTLLIVGNTTGYSYPYRMRLLYYSTNNGSTWTNPNTTDNAWIDFLSLGSGPSSRAIW